VFVLGQGSLRLVNSTIRNGSGWGVRLQNGARASIAETHILSHGGVYALSNAASAVTAATISDSVVSGSAAGNVVARTEAAGALATIAVTRSTIDRSSSGAVTATTNDSGTAVVTIGNCTIVGNNTAWNQAGAGSSIVSMGNNHITNWGFTTGVLTPAALQ
jgi:hypothetical protein